MNSISEKYLSFNKALVQTMHVFVIGIWFTTVKVQSKWHRYVNDVRQI